MIGTVGECLLSRYILCIGECWVDKKVTDPPFTVLNKKWGTIVLWTLLQYGELGHRFASYQERRVYRVIPKERPEGLERGNQGLERGSLWNVQKSVFQEEGMDIRYKMLNRNDNMKLKEVYNLRYQRWRRKHMRDQKIEDDIKCR